MNYFNEKPDKIKCLNDFLVDKFNNIIKDEKLWNSPFFKDSSTKSYAKMEIRTKANQVKDNEIPILNRIILENAYPNEIKNFIQMSRAAEHGLCLPARGVLDLWQLAYWVVNDFKNKKFGAEKIARNMLRNAIAGSEIGSVIAKCLQYNIIRRTKGDGTELYFGRETAKLKKSFLTFGYLEKPPKLARKT